MNKKVLCFFSILLPAFLTFKPAAAQVSIAPTSVFIHDRDNVASLFVSNGSQVAQEISISFEFAYPGSDESGNMTTIENDSVSAQKFGLGSRVKVFPRQFVLAPNGQQTVRFQVLPLQGKPDGVYWTRIIISSQQATKDVDTVKVSQGIGTKINFVLKQNIPCFYIKGKVSTGLSIADVKSTVEKNKLTAVTRVLPTGNAPFNGSVIAKLTNDSGKEVTSHQQTIVAYFEALRKIEIPLPEGIKSGKYNLELTYETSRADISPSDLVQATPVKKTVVVVIP